MANLQDLITQIPIGDLAAKLGVDESTASEAVAKAIPALLSGMQANAEAGGASSLEKAVSKHSGELVDGGVNLDQVDTTDGQKIVSHVFGSNTDQVASALGGSGGGIGDVIGKAMPMLAPIVMSFLSQMFSGKKQTPAKTTTAKSSGKTIQSAAGQASGQSSGGIGDLLGGLLGGGASSTQSGGGLADILGGLGGLLGGGSK